MGSKAILLLGFCLAVLLLIASEVTAMDFAEVPISNEKTAQGNGVDDAKYGGGGYPGVGYGGYPSGGYVGNRGGEREGGGGGGYGGHRGSRVRVRVRSRDPGRGY